MLLRTRDVQKGTLTPVIWSKVLKAIQKKTIKGNSLQYLKR